METLILNPTSTAQWQALVKCAEENSSITLNEEMESYLIFLLMRYLNDAQLVSHIMAEAYLNSHSQTLQQQFNQLQAVGDECLLFAGLFTGLAEKRRVKISYYVMLGKTAYYELSGLCNNSLKDLYQNLYANFVDLRDVLQTLRNLDNNPLQDLTPLEAIELWQETGSKAAFNSLRKTSKGLPVYDTSKTYN